MRKAALIAIILLSTVAVKAQETFVKTYNRASIGTLEEAREDYTVSEGKWVVFFGENIKIIVQNKPPVIYYAVSVTKKEDGVQVFTCYNSKGEEVTGALGSSLVFIENGVMIILHNGDYVENKKSI